MPNLPAVLADNERVAQYARDKKDLACMAAGMTVEQVAELQFAYPTFTEGVSMAAQKICRKLGIGHFPQVWSFLGVDE